MSKIIPNAVEIMGKILDLDDHHQRCIQLPIESELDTLDQSSHAFQLLLPIQVHHFQDDCDHVGQVGAKFDDVSDEDIINYNRMLKEAIYEQNMRQSQVESVEQKMVRYQLIVSHQLKLRVLSHECFVYCEIAREVSK